MDSALNFTEEMGLAAEVKLIVAYFHLSMDSFWFFLQENHLPKTVGLVLQIPRDIM